MDSGREMHQQFLKDFIHSLQGNSDDSYSLSESSLNPNAAEFVPSYKRSSDDEDEVNCQAKAKEEMGTSTTTLIRQDGIGDTAHLPRLDTQNRIQRQLFNLMDQLGNHEFPLSAIQFSLASDAQGINVRFMMPGVVSRPTLDDHLCQASGLRVELSNQESHSGNVLAAQFLNRMCAALNGKSQTKEPSICPRCTALPKKHSYTELEIERQIEDIKAFEKLINNDAGTRYQEAFKELCHKLGLAPPEEQFVNAAIKPESGSLPIPASIPVPINENHNEHYTGDHEMSFNDDEELTGYEWDSFTTGFDHTNVYRLTDVHEEDMVTDDMDMEKDQLPTKTPPKDEYQLSAPPTTPAMSTTAANVNSVFPKLYKVAQMKCNTNARKTANHKEKETKLQRNRLVSPSRGVATTGITIKKQPEPLFVTGNRAKTQTRELPLKSGVVRNHIPEMAASQVLKSNCKIEPRSTVKHQSENKHCKAATLPRSTGGTGQAQTARFSQTGASTRVVAPRMTQASKMRQSEVKRRLSLMRGEDTDVQFNEYLFK